MPASGSVVDWMVPWSLDVDVRTISDLADHAGQDAADEQDGKGSRETG